MQHLLSISMELESELITVFQIVATLVELGVIFLVIRLLIIKNFPRKKPKQH